MGCTARPGWPRCAPRCPAARNANAFGSRPGLRPTVAEVAPSRGRCLLRRAGAVATNGGQPPVYHHHMARVADRSLSRLVQAQLANPSPIRQTMKMAERQNILAMGLDPDQVISFGGGWVNHAAPEGLRQAYKEIADARGAFHRSGAYTATLGDMECREQLARFESHLFG